MKNVKHLIALFFAALFLTLKLAGLHAFVHHADDADFQHCDLCEHTTTVSFTPLLASDSEALPQPKILFSGLKLKSGAPQIVFYGKPEVTLHFSRPPPQLS